MRILENAPARAAALSVAALLLTGCGSPGSQAGAAHAPSPHGSSGHGVVGSMAGMEMGGHERPSGSASMICSDEIRDAVTRTFALAVAPSRSDSWSRSDRIYTCGYRMPGGTLTLSVQDSLSRPEGSAYFAGVRSRLPHARAIRGIDSLGFPAVTSRSGRVAFLKDGKTLVVDASSLPKTALPEGYTRSEVAYSAASAVIGCWKE